MAQVTRILHLEDDPADRELVQAQLEEGGIVCQVTWVQSGLTFEATLLADEFDLILADYRLPAYDGLAALRSARETCPEVPFLFVSGTMGEDAAIEGLTAGATDYVLKTRLSRLAPAVRRALEESANRRGRKRAEDELRKLSRAVEQSVSTVVITDPQGSIEYANPRFTATTGYAIEEYLGKHTRLLKSGHTSPEEYQRLWATITSGRQWRGVFRNKKKNGDLYWETATISPIKNDQGVITHFLAVKEDITDLKKAEEARVKLEEQLRHAQKLDALGRLAGGVAHDFNNLLCVIVGCGELMQSRLPASDPNQADLEEVLRAAERATQLSRSLLIFSRREPAKLKPLLINELIEGMKKMVLRLIGEDIETRLQLSSEPLTVLGDYGQLEQVLTNLATNARDAMAGGGVLTLKTDQRVLDADFVQAHGFGSEGPYAVITVADTGVGMDSALLERIFDPFFTTKSVERGTGLGLSIVYGIVQQHQGHIECSSQPGKGTTFTIYLPLVSVDLTQQEKEGAAKGPVPGGHETILLAEDEAAIRGLFRKILEQHGYTVIEAKDGAEAVSTFIEHQGRVDLAVLDAVMPKKSGRVALDEMRAFRPGLKALFVAGYSETAARHPDDGSLLLKKPVRPRELLVRVRELLDSKR